MKKARNREVHRSEHRSYLKAAQDYLASAQDNHGKKRFVPACGDAVHAMIAAGDTLTIYFLGRRSASQHHLDAINLLKQAGPQDEDLRHQITRYQRVLGLKDAAEYGGGKVNEGDAQSAVRDAERFLSFVQDRIR